MSPFVSPFYVLYSQGMKTGFLAALAAYAAVLWAAGLAFRGGRRSGAAAGPEAFFLASRRLGAFRVAFSLCAAWIGAASLLVSTDEACRDGLSAAWIVGVPAVVTLLVLAVLAPRVRAASGETLSGLMAARYGRAAGGLTTGLVVWYMTVLAASQMAAAGPFLGTLLGAGPFAGLAVAAGIAVVYAAAGGLQAVARTHVVQFGLLLAGIAALVSSLAGRTTWGAVRAAAAAAGKTGYFDPLAGGGRNLLVALSFVLAWTISPVAWQRLQAARGAGSARRGALAAALLLGLFYAGIVVAGMLFLPLFPDGGAGVPLVTRFAALEAGRLVGGLVFVTVLAAILSTMDAALNAGAFALAGGVHGRDAAPSPASAPVSPPVPSARPLLRARLSTVALAAAALLIAARLGDVLRTLGLASAIMAEGLLVPGLAALFLKRRAPLAGLLALILGGGHALAAFLGETGLRIVALPPWPRSLPLGVGLGAAGFLTGLAVERLRARRLRPPRPAAPAA